MDTIIININSYDHYHRETTTSKLLLFLVGLDDHDCDRPNHPCFYLHPHVHHQVSNRPDHRETDRRRGSGRSGD